MADDNLEAKKKALIEAISRIKKSYGEGSIMMLGEDQPVEKVKSISTGSILIDYITGIGGIPKGRITEVYGHESSGKTTLCLHMIAEVQKEGGIAAFIDVEHALDPVYAKAIGVALENLVVSQPESGEEALNIVDTLIRSNSVDIIVIDSVAALLPKAETTAEVGDSTIGIQARLMSQALRKITSVASKSNTAIVFTNQLRMKISTGFSYGGPQETTTGGTALKYYASMRIETKKGENIKRSGTDEVIGNICKVKISKNKVAPPFKLADVYLIYGKGFSKAYEILNIGPEIGIIKKSGNWYYYNDDKLGNGLEQAVLTLEQKPELLKSLEIQIRQKLGISIPSYLK
ncbi:MAG: recombinase RecA [Brevinematales bacterium]|nr:recombinase RecA [Brevinematales bacterium]